MKWFKHSTGSHDDPDIADAMDLLGDFGYSGFFIILEVYADEFTHRDECDFITVSNTFLRRKLRKSSEKVELLLNFYSERQRIESKKENDKISLKVPKFIELASNWSKRKPTEVTPEAPTAREEEVEVDKIKDKIHMVKSGDLPASDEEVKEPKYSESFELFWNTYPRKIGKGAAYKAWQTIGTKKKATARQIISAVEKQIKAGMFDLSENKTHCPHASTWLNRDGWLDEIIVKTDKTIPTTPLLR